MSSFETIGVRPWMELPATRAVIEALETGCRVQDRYHSRMEEFFGPERGSRREAVHNAIVALGPSARRRCS